MRTFSFFILLIVYVFNVTKFIIFICLSAINCTELITVIHAIFVMFILLNLPVSNFVITYSHSFANIVSGSHYLFGFQIEIQIMTGCYTKVK